MTEKAKKLAMTAAQRQQAYRQRQREKLNARDTERKERINLFVPVMGKVYLEKLAKKLDCSLSDAIALAARVACDELESMEAIANGKSDMTRYVVLKYEIEGLRTQEGKTTP